jgi:broad-specificity NMP kinase
LGWKDGPQADATALLSSQTVLQLSFQLRELFVQSLVGYEHQQVNPSRPVETQLIPYYDRSPIATELNETSTVNVTEFDAAIRESAVGTLSQILGPVAMESVLSYLKKSPTMDNPEELHLLLTLLFGKIGSSTLEQEMLKSVSTKLGDESPSLVDDSHFELKQVVKKTIFFNRMHAIMAALQPRSGPRPDADLRVTPTDGLTFDSEITQSNYAGDYFHSIFEKVRRILIHQLKSKTTAGITGFIFQGPPGLGKTTLAKAIARDLALELIYVDSSTVARAKYGESEKQIVKAFEEGARRPSLILIDDAEAIFPSRDSPTNREEFFSGQNNVIFHQLDAIKTSNPVVILTTNKPEQLDPALRDRLYQIQFPELDLRTIEEIARLKCSQRKISPDTILARIRAAPDSVRSVRALEKMATEEYILTIERADFVERERSNAHASSRSIKASPAGERRPVATPPSDVSGELR